MRLDWERKELTINKYYVTHLWFGDDIALFGEKSKEMEWVEHGKYEDTINNDRILNKDGDQYQNHRENKIRMEWIWKAKEYNGEQVV